MLLLCVFIDYTDSEKENKTRPSGRVRLWRGGRDSNSIPPAGTRGGKTKRAPYGTRSILAGRAGFEPADGLTHHSLSRRAQSATLAPPRLFSSRFQVEGTCAKQTLNVRYSNM